MRESRPNVDAFISRLKDEDKSPFEDRFGKYIEDIKDSQVRSAISTELSLHSAHTELVRSMASGFTQESTSQGSESNFIFQGTDPLYEERSVGADLLLARKQRRRIHICIVFCEVGDENLSDWVENIESGHGLFDQDSNKEKLITQLGFDDQEIGEIQYLLVSRPNDLEAIPPSDIISRCSADQIGVWSCETESGLDICHEYGANIHRDLRQIADGCFEWDEQTPIRYTLATEPIIMLKDVILRLIREKKRFSSDEHILEFNREDFFRHYGEKLGLVNTGEGSRAEMKKSVSDILDLGENIGILSTRDTNTVRDYRIMFSGNTDDPIKAKNAAEGKFINWQLEVRKEWLAFNETKKSFTSIQSDLDEYGESE